VKQYLPQYAFMAWCSVKTQGELYVLPYKALCKTCIFYTPVYSGSITLIPSAPLDPSDCCPCHRSLHFFDVLSVTDSSLVYECSVCHTCLLPEAHTSCVNIEILSSTNLMTSFSVKVVPLAATYFIEDHICTVGFKSR
jgi:hypothetical protein